VESRSEDDVLSDLQTVTSDLIRVRAAGGTPPFGYAHAIRTIMDPDLGRFEKVWAAAGTANTVFSVTPQTLRVLANAVVAPIAASPSTPTQPAGERAAGAPSGA